MSMITDHIAEFLQGVIDESPSIESAREAIEAAVDQVLPAPATRTVVVSQLKGCETLVNANGNPAAIDGEIGPSNSMPSIYRIETEHGVLYLDPDTEVEILAD